MILPVYNRDGKEVDRIEINEDLLGGRVNSNLLKQALVMYHANKRQGTVATKGRSLVEGSTRKLYKQKGTGNARAGTIRTPIRKGGGVTFGKLPRDLRLQMPAKQRRLARNQAVLAKLRSSDAVVIDSLKFSVPKTKELAKILSNLKIDRSCLVATDAYDLNVYKSLRNIPKVEALMVAQLNAGDICMRRKLLFTRAALESFLKGSSPTAANA